MMFRLCLMALLVLVGPTVQGCGLFGSSKSHSNEAIDETTQKSEQGDKEVVRLRVENTNLKSDIDALTREREEIRRENLKELALMEGNVVSLKEQLRKLKAENQKVSSENQLLRERLEGSQQKGDQRALKIKVLSGDGNLRSAKEMAKMLMGMNYDIRLIDYAPRSDFQKNTVYFATRFEREGKNLVSAIGPNAVLKPLTWPSAFDLIVVTGKSY